MDKGWKPEPCVGKMPGKRRPSQKERDQIRQWQEREESMARFRGLGQVTWPQNLGSVHTMGTPSHAHPSQASSHLFLNIVPLKCLPTKPTWRQWQTLPYQAHSLSSVPQREILHHKDRSYYCPQSPDAVYPPTGKSL